MIKEISICMGSSCFCRGNEQNLKIIEEFLLAHDMKSQVLLKGGRCAQLCDKGPVVSIDGEVFYGVDGPMLQELLLSHMGK